MRDQQIDSATVHCFIDTNILVHFQTFDEVDWCSVLAAPQVYLLLAPAVIGELNLHKDDSSNQWRQRRARMLVSKLKTLLIETPPGQPAHLRHGTFVVDIAQEPIVNWSALGLDPSTKDDRLLATIIEYARGHPQAPLIFISDDFLAQRKATSRGIQVVEPEGRIERIERPSPETSTIRQLEQQIATLKSRTPELTLSFWENDGITNRIVCPFKASKTGGPSDADIAEEISRKRQKSQEIITRAGSKVEENEISKFLQDYDEYLDNLEAYLEMKRAREFGQRCKLAFILRNVGSAPALDVEVALHFPLGSHVVEASEEYDDLLFEAMAPKEPIPRWTREQSLLSPLVSFDGMLAPPRPQPPERPMPRGPLYDDYYHRSTVYYTHPKLRHKESWFLDPIVTNLPPAVRGGFQIPYSIHADNLVSPIEGQLHVILRQEE